MDGVVKRVVLLPGQALIMPSGTPHMVRTVESSIARGINFIAGNLG